MTERPLRGVLRGKDLRNPYLLVGLAGRIAATHERDSPTNKLLDRLLGRFVLSKLKPVDDPDIRARYAEVSHWHGTGRFKYDNGGTVDVLQSIAASGLILPSYDAFDLNRPMTSISLARSRAYGRAYADMHGRGINERERYGSSLFWACAFLGSVAVEAAKEAKVWRPHGYYRMMEHLRDANAIEWYKKITRATDPTVVDVYRHGSDIVDNYPVLFGVRNVTPTDTSRAVAIHEVRTEQPLALDTDITHVEVPRVHIEETRRLLGSVAIMAIEDGEHFAAQYSFSEHIHNAV